MDSADKTLTVQLKVTHSTHLGFIAEIMHEYHHKYPVPFLMNETLQKKLEAKKKDFMC